MAGFRLSSMAVALDPPRLTTGVGHRERRMGVSVHPVIEREDASWTAFKSAGKPLAKVALDLEKAAKRHGVQPLYHFYSMSREEAIADVLGGDPDDPSSYDETKVPPEAWFEAKAGLKTVSWCSQYVEEHRNRFDEPDLVLNDLREFVRILSQAKSLGLQWHLGQSC